MQRNSGKCRPISVPFLISTSGKGTDTATTMELEKSRRINFSLGRWSTGGKKNAQIGEETCQLSRGTCQNFFIHFCGRGSHFPQGHFFGSKNVNLKYINIKLKKWVAGMYVIDQDKH